MPIYGDNFALELAVHRGLVRQLMRAQPQLVLILAADAVNHGQHFSCHAHHARGLGDRATHAWVDVDIGLVHHRQVPQMLHAAHQVDIAHAGHNICRSSMQG